MSRFHSKMPHLSESARRQIEAAESQVSGSVNPIIERCDSSPDAYSGTENRKPDRPARAQQPSAGRMNKTETAYAQHLELQRLAGEILWYRFEAVKLRLATKTFYTPDFAVISRDGVVQLHEVKGHWEDDARVKIKVAAEMYPFFRFLAVQKRRQRDGGGWHVETFR